MRRALPFVLILALFGCKGSRESEVAGDWKSAAQTMTIDPAKTFKAQMGPMNVDGTWTMEGGDVTLVPKNLNGKPVAELKTQLQKSLAAVPAAQKKEVEAFIKDIDTPNILTLSEDGKTLTTNKEKDKNAGPGMTLTKV